MQLDFDNSNIRDDNPDDFKAITNAIFTQGLDDYTKLQHPAYRREKYLFEDFLTAVAMFFDPSYEFAHIQDQEGQDLNLQSMVDILLDGYGHKYKSAQEYLIKTSREFWEKKNMTVIEIPSTVQIDGHVYFVEHTDTAREDHDLGFDIDFGEKIIFLDRRGADTVNQELLVLALMTLVFHHEGITISGEKLRALGRAWFRMLKMNDCFTGVGYEAPVAPVKILEEE